MKNQIEFKKDNFCFLQEVLTWYVKLKISEWCAN